VAFVSLDDDSRQLDDFLALKGNPLRSTWWLKDGPERARWLELAGVEKDPSLPVHILVGPDATVRCHINGAVEDGDYERIQQLLGAARR